MNTAIWKKTLSPISVIFAGLIILLSSACNLAQIPLAEQPKPPLAQIPLAEQPKPPLAQIPLAKQPNTSMLTKWEKARATRLTIDTPDRKLKSGIRSQRNGKNQHPSWNVRTTSQASPHQRANLSTEQEKTANGVVLAPPSDSQMTKNEYTIPGLIENPNTITNPETTDFDKGLDENRFDAPPPPPARSKVPRVALLLPLSGQHSKIGNSFLNAAQLALFHFAGKNFELLPQDTRGTPEGAAEAAALAIGDGASLILGPLFSSSVEAIAPPARAAGITVISFSNDKRVAGDGVFTMGFLPEEQVESVVKFAFKRGMRRFAILAPDNSYGTTTSAALETVAIKLGGEITGVGIYDPLEDDFNAVVKKLADYDNRRQNLLNQRKDLEGRDDEIARQAIKRLENLQTLGDVPFDALLLADGGKRLQALAALLPYYDIDPNKTRILGTGQWDAADIGSEPALVGGWFAAPALKSRQTFINQYKEIYGTRPIRLATLAYDATALAAVLVKSDGSFDVSEITVPQGFAGRDGIFRFNTEGYAERSLSIHQVRERSNRIIQGASAYFQTND